jgi:hypothetical protein
MKGVDLYCCNGAGMRFLVRFREVSRMHGALGVAILASDRFNKASG